MALPGGFVDIGETVENAVVREMKEEITLDVTVESLLGVYSDPSRDSRFHTVSIVYVCKAYGIPKGADDAKEAFVYNIDSIPYNQLVFDHSIIIKDYLDWHLKVKKV
jgi:8-oxo-dGTP diphosphatase